MPKAKKPRPKVYEYRRAKGLTVEQILEHDSSGIKPPQYSLIDNGKLLPTKSLLETMCQVMECTPLDLYDKEQLDLMAVQWEIQESPVSIVGQQKNIDYRFSDLPKGNPRIAVRAPMEVIEQVESNLHVLGYKSFGQFFRREIVPQLQDRANRKVGKVAGL